MLRPLLIGVPILLALVGGFVAAMILVPPASSFFTWIVVGYAVLLPATILSIVLPISRAAKRLMAGGDDTLLTRGVKGKGVVLKVEPTPMSFRLNGGVRHHVYSVTMRVDAPGAAPREVKVNRALPAYDAPPAPRQSFEVHTDPADADNIHVRWDGGAAASELTPIDAAAPQEPGPEGRGATLEGRARVEAFQPWPDGTYDLDLSVTPRGRASYRVALRTAVPHERIADMRRGLTLKVLVDPVMASRIAIDWSAGR